MTMLAIAGLLFLAIHIVPATQLRAKAVAAIGEGGYSAVFSLLSLALFIWWVYAFVDTASGARAWLYADWWPPVKAAMLLLAAILFVAGLSSPNPTLPRAGKLLDRPDVGAGIFAVTRHPLMWAFGLWGIAHFLSQPDWRGFWFFCLFAITALGGAVLQEQRKSRLYGASWGNFAAKTSFIPFLALAQGRANLRFSDVGWWRVGLALLLWAALLYLHPWLFRVSPLPGLL
jgi:uncharacterized membrane protein